MTLYPADFPSLFPPALLAAWATETDEDLWTLVDGLRATHPELAVRLALEGWGDTLAFDW